MTTPNEQEETFGSERENALTDGVARMLRSRRDTLRERVPVDVERSIRMAIAAEMASAEQQTAARPGVFSALFGFLRRPAILVTSGLTVATLVVISLLRPTAASSSAVNLHDVAYANFNGVVRGTLQLARQTSDTVALRSFFTSAGVSFPVFFPPVQAELKGGVVSTENGHAYAHLVYGVGDHLVYLFEADQPSIDGGVAALDTSIVNDLASGRWHWEERPGTGTMFVWKSNNVVCLAVSDLHTQDMSALFTLEAL